MFGNGTYLHCEDENVVVYNDSFGTVDVGDGRLYCMVTSGGYIYCYEGCTGLC